MTIEVKLTVELEDSFGNDKESIKWLKQLLIDDGSLMLYSNKVPDIIGTVTSVSIINQNVEEKCPQHGAFNYFDDESGLVLCSECKSPI